MYLHELLYSPTMTLCSMGGVVDIWTDTSAMLDIKSGNFLEKKWPFTTEDTFIKKYVTLVNLH